MHRGRFGRVGSSGGGPGGALEVAIALALLAVAVLVGTRVMIAQGSQVPRAVRPPAPLIVQLP
jgi:hypothetical protein